MARWNRRSCAHYSRNYGNEWSRSANAQEAENNGRYPRTRAAAALGVSVKAFDAGRFACGYHTSEWHHVGKYANMVDYYDTNELRGDPQFWQGCAAAYKSKARQTELLEKAKTLCQNHPSSSPWASALTDPSPRGPSSALADASVAALSPDSSTSSSSGVVNNLVSMLVTA